MRLEYTQWGSCALNICQNKYFPYGPKSRLIRALFYTYPKENSRRWNFTELEDCLLCQCVARSIRRSVRLCTDCLSANQIKEFVHSVFQSVYNKRKYWQTKWQIHVELWKYEQFNISNNMNAQSDIVKRCLKDIFKLKFQYLLQILEHIPLYRFHQKSDIWNQNFEDVNCHLALVRVFTLNQRTSKKQH